MTAERSEGCPTRILSTGILVLLAVSVGLLVVFAGGASAQTATCDATVAAGDSIQSAVNNASHGDTICVESGTYAEEVTLNVTGVSLVAADHENPPVLGGTGLEVGVTIVNDSVSVDGFEIRNYGQWGIEAGPFTASQDVSIRNNTIANNSNGLRAGGLTNGKVVNNTIVDNEGEFGNPGIQLWDSHGIEIRENNVSNNGDIGIGQGTSDGSDNTVIANNTLLDNGDTAIDYRSSGTNNEITDNLVGGSNSGIRAGSDAVVTNNTVEVSGIGISGTTSTEIANNSVSGGTTGISLGPASNAIVRDNDVTAAQVGIRVEDTTDIGSPSANVTNNTASGNSVDLWLTGSEGVVVTNNTFETGVGLHSDPIDRANFVHTFENNTVQGDPLFYATGVDDPTIPDTVGQVIVANATNVTVEGHAFDGVAVPIQVYFGDDTDIRANTIQNDSFEEMALIRRGSISVLESRGVLVRDNQITGGTVGETSIHLDGGREVAVVNNTVSDSPAYGIHIGSFGADHEVRENTVSGAGEDGIRVTGSIGGQGNLAGVVVADNQVSGSAQYGIHVRAQAQGTKLTGNTVTDNAVQGIRVIDSTDAWIEANDVSQNDGAGLLVEGDSANATIADNVASANLGPGIHVRPDPDNLGNSPDNVTLLGNDATDNDEDDGSYTASYYGIRVEGIETALVGNNFVTGNDRGGILVEAAVDVQVGHNTVADNGDVDSQFPNTRSGTGIHVIGSSAVTVHGNTVTDSPVHGIEVEAGSSDVDVSDNNVEQNTRRGIFVEDSNDVRVKTNIIRNNDIGIFVASITAGSSADSVVLSGNLVELNTREGVIVTGADEVYADANDFLDNAVGIHLEGATDNATLRDNDIAGNTLGINGSGADHVVDARENWWGADNGPSGGVADPVTLTLADGDGDPVSENVRFDPWSSEESPGTQDGISTCTTIDEAGVHRLSSDIKNATASTCIVITASDVVLDGQGHRVDMDGSGTAINVTSPGSIENVTVRDLTIENSSYGIVVHAPGNDAVVDVEVVNNVVNDSTGAGITVAAGGVNSTADLDISNNRLDTPGDAIGNLDIDGDRASVNLSITDNVITSDNRGIDNPSANDANQTVHIVIAGNDINASDDGIYGLELYGDDSQHTISIVENTIWAGDSNEGIQFIEVGGGANQTIDINVSANYLRAGTTGIGNINPGGSNTTASVTVSDNVVNAGGNGIATVEVGSDARSANVTVARNHVTAATDGIRVKPAAAIGTSTGGLQIDSNTVHVDGSAVVVESGPVDGIEIHNNSLTGDAYGVENQNTTAGTYVNATNNFWNSSDGPASPGYYADPVTGALANGTGSTVTNVSGSSTANVHFDPWLSPPAFVEFTVTVDSTNSPVDEGETLTVDATIENTGDVSGTQTVNLSVDGTVHDSSSVTLASGATTTVSLTWTTSNGDAGDYTATVASENDTASVTVTVDSTSSGSSSGGSSSSGGTGGTGPSTSTPTPTATATPTPTASPSPDPTATPESTSSPTASPAATDTATPTASPTPSPTTTETDGQPGFGLVVALLTIALFAGARRRRR